MPHTLKSSRKDIKRPYQCKRTMATLEEAAAAADARLAQLKMPANASLQEGQPLASDEQIYLADTVTPLLRHRQQTLSAIDVTSCVRIFRGMITNNKGPLDQRLREAVEAYDRAELFFATDCLLEKPLPGEAILSRAMNTLVGGEDLYGHLVWCECLGDIAKVVDAGVTCQDAVRMRCRVMEAIRRLQARKGSSRYKQVYILDLSEISLGSLLTSSKVRDMTKAIVGGANDFFPETLWKLFIVNAPFVFRSAYSVVSPMIHPTTKEKIKILGSSFLSEMEASGVPLTSIPRRLGGSCPDAPLVFEGLGPTTPPPVIPVQV